MAIAPTSLTASFTDTDGTSAVTASITLPANSLILAVVHTSRGTSATQAVAAASTGATWVVVNATTFNTIATPRSRVTILRTMVASDQTGAVTFSCSASHDCWIWSIIAFSDVDTSGTNGSGAIVQSNVNAANGNGLWSVTLSAFGDATNNATYIGVSYDLNNTFTPDSPLTALNENASTTPARDLWDGWNLGENTSPSGSSSTADFGAVALEIKAGVSALTSTPTVGAALLGGVTPTPVMSAVLKPAVA